MGKNWVEITASLLGGAGIGAALMYMFDPDKGEERRDHLGDQAHGALGHTGEAMGRAWEAVSSRAADVGGSVADYTASAARSAGNVASNLYGSARDSARGLLGSVGDKANDWADSAKGSYKRGITRASSALGAEHEGTGATGMTITAISALALGAGLMFMLDPTAGRRRRAVAVNGAGSAASQAGGYISDAAQAVGGKAADVYQGVASKITGSTPADKGNPSSTGYTMPPTSRPAGSL